MITKATTATITTIMTTPVMMKICIINVQEYSAFLVRNILDQEQGSI